ncbi:MAG: pantoate--beta-alanine ligase [Planctomycetota bacterium]
MNWNPSPTEIVRQFDSIASIHSFVRDRQADGQTVGLVPTMGALHEGHLSLVRRARDENETVVVTIFVNPTQFAAGEDLQAYPRPIEQDLDCLAAEQVDAVFVPDHSTMYPDGYGTFVQPPPIAHVLEGKHRPTHFRGVATIVLKLLHVIPADAAYFGQKDFQQLRVIETMVQDFNCSTRIVRCPIVRDPDGLALSSRNAYLTDTQRRVALSLSRGLAGVAAQVNDGVGDIPQLERTLRESMAEADQIDYACIVDTETMMPITELGGSAIAVVAARIGNTRLIDNLILPNKLKPLS